MNTEKRLLLNAERTDTLDEGLREEAKELLQALEDKGFAPLVTQATRSMDVQAALFAQGRLPLVEVDALRKKAGMDPLEEGENKIVTKAKPGQSLHNFGMAIDIVNYPDGGSPEWENMGFYRTAALLFTPKGWSWGGNFERFTDYPHFEKDLRSK